jgi:hypothetical protein
MTAGQLRARNLRTVAALAALFVSPLLIAFFTYYGSAWRPAGQVNHGTLITPPRPLPASALPRGKWTLLYVGDGACDSACREALHVMRQTRLALNNDMTRVERTFLATAHCCAREFLSREHAGLVVLDGASPAEQPLLRELSAPAPAHLLYIVDPLGNLVMSYDARSDPHGLLEDLKKLLRLSHIG